MLESFQLERRQWPNRDRHSLLTSQCPALLPCPTKTYDEHSWLSNKKGPPQQNNDERSWLSLNRGCCTAPGSRHALHSELQFHAGLEKAIIPVPGIVHSEGMSRSFRARASQWGLIRTPNMGELRFGPVCQFMHCGYKVAGSRSPICIVFNGLAHKQLAEHVSWISSFPDCSLLCVGDASACQAVTPCEMQGQLLQIQSLM